MNRQELADSLNREQQHSAILLITHDLEALKKALLEEALKKERLPIPLNSGCYKASAAELARSLDDNQLGGVIANLAVYSGRFKQHLLVLLVTRADQLIQRLIGEGKTRETVIQSLSPLELLMHMHFSARNSALAKCPETPRCVEACSECSNKEFAAFFGVERTTKTESDDLQTPNQSKRKKNST